MKPFKPLRLSMQYFADDGAGNIVNQDKGDDKDDKHEDTKPNYEELFKTDTNLQAFISKQVQTATTAALEKERVLNDEKATEAEKLAKMNDKEKQQYQIEKMQKQINQYEQAENVRKLHDEAVKTAEEKKIPIALVDLIDFGNLKAKDVATKLDGIKTAYDAAIKEGIAQALDGAGTPKGEGYTEKESTGSIMKIIEENQANR